MTRAKRPIAAIKFIVLHHTASADRYSTHETLAEHLKATGLGYHVTVDDDLALQAKAAGSDGKFTFKQQAPDDEVVWGAAGCNFNGWHIAIDGNTKERPPTDDEKHAVVQIIAAKARAWGWRKGDVLGTRTAPSRIVGHYYVGSHISAKRYGTECPGPPLIAWLPELRVAVAAYLED